jgi:hypothetical protein
LFCLLIIHFHFVRSFIHELMNSWIDWLIKDLAQDVRDTVEVVKLQRRKVLL